jgi:hypothetical protein
MSTEGIEESSPEGQMAEIDAPRADEREAQMLSRTMLQEAAEVMPNNPRVHTDELGSKKMQELQMSLDLDADVFLDRLQGLDLVNMKLRYDADPSPEDKAEIMRGNPDPTMSLEVGWRTAQGTLNEVTMRNGEAPVLKTWVETPDGSRTMRPAGELTVPAAATLESIRLASREVLDEQRKFENNSNDNTGSRD